MDEKKDVWVLLEAENNRIRPCTLSLIDEGKQLVHHLGGSLNAVFLGPWPEGLDRLAGSYGADGLYWFADDALASYVPEIYEKLLVRLFLEKTPLLVMAAASALGSDLMPRLAAKLKAPLVTYCMEIRVENGLEFIKPVQNGRLHATTICKSGNVKMVTMNPADLIPVKEKPVGAAAKVVEMKPDFQNDTLSIQSKGFLKADHRTIDISEAEYIVAVGRGLGDRKNLTLIKALADHIGAAVGGTRPMVDADILPFERQIGQTGKRVSPKLIFLCGISGASEFIRGIEGAGTKLAINIDRQAPIFRTVDLGIVGDMNEVIPRIIDQVIKQHSATSTNGDG